MSHTEQKYLEVLNHFPAIDLRNMDKVKLMDRKDTKFLFREEQLTQILEPLLPVYHVLWVNECYCCPYESVYFDTPDHQMFFDHHRGKLNRYKIRFRKYVGSDTLFFEIKNKTSKGRTVKNRINVPLQHQGIDKEEQEFLDENLRMNPESLVPSMSITFNRITLVNLNSPERVTLDVNLKFHYNGNTAELPGIIIAEAKQERAVKSPFVNQMKQMHIRKGSLSKYCLGISLLVPGIKNNNFRPKIHKFNKLLHDYPAGC
ncbi:MAG: polyphosphate polymerase domain-containing protein [Bacteroidales bacterium]